MLGCNIQKGKESLQINYEQYIRLNVVSFVIFVM